MPAPSILESTINLLFPSRCGGCDALMPERAALCRACEPRVERLGHPRCTSCAVPFEGAGPDHTCGRCMRREPAFTALRAPFLYGGPIADAICRLKYGARTELALPLAKLVVPILGGQRAYDRVIPVPLHPSRLRSRGFNQAALLSAPIAGALGVPLDTGALLRRRATAPQAGLGQNERRRNVRGAFTVHREARARLDGESVLLVDDVVTTAETVAACARALARAGARSIEVAAVARAPW